MGFAYDLSVIDEEDYNKTKLLEGEKLLKIKRESNGNALFFVFEKHTLLMTCQDSENYGFNVFFNIHKTEKKMEESGK